MDAPLRSFGLIRGFITSLAGRGMPDILSRPPRGRSRSRNRDRCMRTPETRPAGSSGSRPCPRSDRRPRTCRSRRPSRYRPGTAHTSSRAVTTHDAEPPAAMIPHAGKHGGRRFLLRRELIPVIISFDRGPREDALAAVRALVEHHLAECRVVVDGRDQAAAAGIAKGRRRAPQAVGNAVVEVEGAAQRIGPVGSRPAGRSCRAER